VLEVLERPWYCAELSWTEVRRLLEEYKVK